jgi:pre-60S factor REI1
MASLSPVAAEVYTERVESGRVDTKVDLSREKDAEASESPLGHDGEQEDEQEDFLPTQCIFCNHDSDTPESNIEHMSSSHGLFLPQIEQLADLDTFIRYLGAIVWKFHECVYCATIRSSKKGIQQHMKDKGHYMLNFDKEPDLIEFWDFSDGESEGDESQEAAETSGGRSQGKAKKLSNMELLLPSGKVISSRSESQSFQRQTFACRREFKAKTMELTEGDAEYETTEADSTATGGREQRLLARRHQMGMIGISDQQKQTLMVTEKKMQKREAVAKAAHRWATEKVANKQKFYKVCTYVTLGLN